VLRINPVTHFLEAVQHGHAQPAAELLPLVYEELRRLAASKMADEAVGNTLPRPWFSLSAIDGQRQPNVCRAPAFLCRSRRGRGPHSSRSSSKQTTCGIIFADRCGQCLLDRSASIRRIRIVWLMPNHATDIPARVRPIKSSKTRWINQPTDCISPGDGGGAQDAHQQ